nr:immunoglobulin heavy chain junction region [Mus musculus]MBK4187517.1 immunoglobulin heavy chain junction region [Mus musculus]
CARDGYYDYFDYW